MICKVDISLHGGLRDRREYPLLLPRPFVVNGTPKVLDFLLHISALPSRHRLKT